MSNKTASPRRVTRSTPDAPPVVTVRASVELSEQTYDAYAEQSVARGLPIEKLMSDRLTRCLPQVTDALVFTAEQKRELDRLLGHTCSDVSGVLQRLTNHLRLEVGDVHVPLEPRVVMRIDSRAKSQRLSFEECLKREVIGALRRFTGLDPA